MSRGRAAANSKMERNGKSSRLLRVLIVDDHPLVRQGLRQVIQDSYPRAVIAEAGLVAQAIALAKAKEWNLALVDIRLPDGGGLDLVHRLKRKHPDLAVLVISMYDEELYGVRAMKSGASGYLMKDTGAKEVIAAVGRVLRGERYVSKALSEHLVSHVQQDWKAPYHASLSEREHQVLWLLASGQSVKDIGKTLSLSVNTVSTYRTRMFQKLHVRTTAALVRYALEQGLI